MIAKNRANNVIRQFKILGTKILIEGIFLLGLGIAIYIILLLVNIPSLLGLGELRVGLTILLSSGIERWVMSSLKNIFFEETRKK